MGEYDDRYWLKAGVNGVVAREFGISREMVSKMRYAVPPGYPAAAASEAAKAWAVVGRNRRDS